MLNESRDFLILFGGFPSIENLKLPNYESILHLNPIEDLNLKANRFMKFEVGSEEGVLLMLAKHLIDDSKLSEEQKEYFDELDMGYISAESSISEEEILEIDKDRAVTLCVSETILNHKRIKNIISILSLISLHIEVLIEDRGEFKRFETKEIDLDEVDCIDEFNGIIIYNYRGDSSTELIGSEQFSRVAKLSDNDRVKVVFGGFELERTFRLDKNLKGTIALNSDFDSNPNLYRYQRVKIDKVVENE